MCIPALLDDEWISSSSFVLTTIITYELIISHEPSLCLAIVAVCNFDSEVTRLPTLYSSLQGNPGLLGGMR